jgi:5'-phosphate synthase pdxT subunit
LKVQGKTAILPEQKSSDALAKPRIGVLAIQGDYDAHAIALQEVGAEPVLVRKPDQLPGLDGLIIPGGESTTFLKFLERDGFLESLRTFVAATPTFGTCAGCILLATNVLHPPQPSLGVLDATVERNAYGRQIDSSIEETATKLGPTFDTGPLETVYIRAPRIQQVGKDVSVLAERDGFPVLVRQGHLLAATFHPELSADRRVHRYFVDMVREAKDSAPTSAHRPRRKS